MPVTFRSLSLALCGQVLCSFTEHVCAHLSINWINHAKCTNVRSTWLYEVLLMLRLVPLKLPLRIDIAFIYDLLVSQVKYGYGILQLHQLHSGQQCMQHLP